LLFDQNIKVDIKINRGKRYPGIIAEKILLYSFLLKVAGSKLEMITKLNSQNPRGILK